MREGTIELGDRAEAFAADLLRLRGFSVVNLNETHKNSPLHDLEASKGHLTFRISVKSDRKIRQISLGRPSILECLGDDDVVMAFITTKKGEEIRFEPGGYELLIIPGAVARNEGLEVHNHYIKSHPGSANHRVMVKDKNDTNPGTKSGAAFKRWYGLYSNAWHVFDQR